jgi:hypothetical protein
MLYTLGSRARLNAIHAGLTSLQPIRRGLPVVFPDRKQEDRRKKASELYPALESNLKMRNRYAHAFFGVDADTGDLVMIERMKLHEWRRLPINDLKHHYDLIKELSDKIQIIVSNEWLQLVPKGARQAGGQPPAP